MKKLFLAAVATLMLGAGIAVAQPVNHNWASSNFAAHTASHGYYADVAGG